MNFVDPTTDVHTQNIENRWMGVKTKQKKQGGICRQLLKIYLQEFYVASRVWGKAFTKSCPTNL